MASDTVTSTNNTGTSAAVGGGADSPTISMDPDTIRAYLQTMQKCVDDLTQSAKGLVTVQDAFIKEAGTDVDKSKAKTLPILDDVLKYHKEAIQTTVDSSNEMAKSIQEDMDALQQALNSMEQSDTETSAQVQNQG